jgi:hypothetical protein
MERHTMKKWQIISMAVVYVAITNAPKLLEAQVYDSTDDIANEKRSGLAIKVDNLTGCEYLMAPFVGLTPRIDSDGKTHIGCYH